MSTFCEELKTWKFWKALVAEFVGTFILLFLGAPSCLGGKWDSVDKAELVSISLTFGITVATVVWCIGHASGGHINPAVSISLAICRRISVVRAFFYIIVQLLGAMAAGGMLYVITPEEARETLCTTSLGPGVQIYQGVIVEAIITFVLILTVLASIDTRRRDLGGSAPLAIGLSVTACHFGFIKYTGASMNPARSFGVAVAANLWTDHWIYWVGPILGGLIASFMYETLFARDASLSNFCCVTFERRSEELPPASEKQETKKGKEPVHV